MRRPIESTEVAFLARLFVRISDAINTTLGLTGPVAVKSSEAPDAREGVVEGDAVPSEEPSEEVALPSRGEVSFSDIVEFVKNFLWQILLVLQLEARNRGWRVNLRFIAEKKFLILSMLALLLYWLVRAIICSVANFFR